MSPMRRMQARRARALLASVLLLGGCGPRVDIVAWMADEKPTAASAAGAPDASGAPGGEGGGGGESPSGTGGSPAPRCDDGMLNGSETDVDCGGPVCDACTTGTLDCARASGDCDGDPSNGCETNLLTSAQNCGACGRQCNLTNADSTCANGVCRIAECRGSFQNCSTDDADGCQTNTDNDPLNCGSCGAACATTNGAARCVSAKCQITCAVGFADCDGDPSNGCETSNDDVNNCGVCGKKCPGNDGVPYCVDGKCGVNQCASGLGACLGDGTCDYDLLNDPENCGRCGHACIAMNGDEQCVNGLCALTACSAGFGDCNGRDNDGCETALTDSSNCGSCGNVCPVEASTCVNANDVNRCQATVGYVNDAHDVAFDTTLSVDHTLVAGTARLLFAAVAVESRNGAGFDDARPATVKYGPVTMNPSGSQTSGPPTEYAPYLYYYFLTEPDLSSSQTLTVTVPPNTADLLTAELIEFTGVDPVNPLRLGTGASFNIASGSCNAVAPITTTEPGTALFVASASHLAGFASAVGSELTTPPLWDAGLIGSNGFRIYGALGGTDGTLIAPGTHTIGFFSDGCSPAVTLPIGIVPYHLE